MCVCGGGGGGGGLGELTGTIRALHFMKNSPIVSVKLLWFSVTFQMLLVL